VAVLPRQPVSLVKAIARPRGATGLVADGRDPDSARNAGSLWITRGYKAARWIVDHFGDPEAAGV